MTAGTGLTGGGSTGAVTLDVDIGTSAGQLFTIDSVPYCAGSKKLQMSPGPTYVWSCVESTSISDAAGNTKIEVEHTANENKIHFSTVGIEHMIIDSSGYVGIGTTSPAQKFAVTGGAYISGNVGVGVSSPTAKLDVNGAVKFGNTSSTCSGSSEGQQRYNSTSHEMEFCNGTSWTVFGSTASVPEGTMCGSRVVTCIGSGTTPSYDTLSMAVSCQGQTLSITACDGGTSSKPVAVAGCPSGYSGFYRFTGILIGPPNYFYYAIGCYKN
ncbi:MAG: hypothetical protein H6623_01420 [Bdellovibrionaceae bacterium]|nr:hypothetical protein [Pseudobdellovibrionaceae bacterium]